MNKFKAIMYNPKDPSINVPALMNNELRLQHTNYTDEYLIFIQDDIVQKAKNTNDLFNKYASFCDEFDLPFAMYQYYNTFNRVLQDSLNRVNPRLIVHTAKTNQVFDIVLQVAYGFVIIRTKDFLDMNFVFNESYKHIFYLQDMMEKFFQAKKYYSNCALLEMHNSQDLFKDESKHDTGYVLDMNLFNEERERYFKENKIEYTKSLNDVLGDLKAKFNPVEVTSGVVSTDSNNISLVDIQSLINQQK